MRTPYEDGALPQCYVTMFGSEGRDRTYENSVNSGGHYHSGHFGIGYWSSLADSNRVGPDYKTGHHRQCLESVIVLTCDKLVDELTN